MSAQTSEGRQTSIPNREVELRSSGNGPVITYQLSPEELERYRAMPVSVNRNQDGRRIGKPISTYSEISPEEQRLRAKIRYEKENTEMKEARFTKEDYIALRVEGLSDAEIAKKFEVSTPNLKQYYKGKWGLKDPDQEEMAILAAVGSASPVQKPEPKTQGLIALNASNGVEASPTGDKDLKERLDRALDRISTMTETVNATLDANESLKKELDVYKQAASDLGREIDNQADHVVEIERLRNELAEQIGQRNILTHAMEHARLSIEELESDRQILLATIEMASNEAKTAPKPARAGRSIHTELDAPTEQIVDELAALISYIRSGSAKAFYLDLQLNEVTAAL